MSNQFYVFGYGRHKHIRDVRTSSVPVGVCGAAGDYPAMLTDAIDRPICPRCKRIYPFMERYRELLVRAAEIALELNMPEEEFLRDCSAVFRLEVPGADKDRPALSQAD